VHAREYLLVEVTGEDGATGIGYAYIGTRGAAAAAALTAELLAPVALAAADDSPVALWPALYQETLLAGRRGIVLRAMSALDIALWDLRARRAGLPLAALLGGDAAAAVPAYASGGYYRPAEGDPAEYVRREIAGNREAGFADHKIKVGGLTVAEDARRVRAAREVIGDSGRLAVDANNAYRSVHEAADALRAFEDASGGLWWFEEPLGPDLVDGHHRLAERASTPIATGEIHQTRWEYRQLIGGEGVAVLQPDAGVLGGVTEWLRVAQAASVADLPVAPHWHANLHAQLAGAVDNCLVVEHFDLEKDIYNFEELLVPETRLAVADGAVRLSGRPGLGIELDPAKVERYRVA
jgi:L-alanine-DL-glutamate epimerase-like enolase superfamily enzyme